jgi:hypothetical protein
MFLISKAYAGAAATPELLEAFREPDRAAERRLLPMNAVRWQLQDGRLIDQRAV